MIDPAYIRPMKATYLILSIRPELLLGRTISARRLDRLMYRGSYRKAGADVSLYVDQIALTCIASTDFAFRCDLTASSLMLYS